MAEKVDIGRAMRAFDAKDRAFYDNLSDEEKKGFSPFMMIRWGTNVSGDEELQAYYLIAGNERLNKNFFDINRHPKLQWLLATTVSPDLGMQRHNWQSGPKKSKHDGDKVRTFISQLYPHLSDDEVDLLYQINDKNTWKTLAEETGMPPDEIKKLFS